MSELTEQQVRQLRHEIWQVIFDTGYAVERYKILIDPSLEGLDHRVKYFRSLAVGMAERLTHLAARAEALGKKED